MADHCCAPPPLNLEPQERVRSYRRVLLAVFVINAAMFAVEVGAGVAAGSASLQADALDFLGDAANYGISLFVIGKALRYRATAALAKWQAKTEPVVAAWADGRKNGKEALDKYRALYAQAEAEQAH